MPMMFCHSPVKANITPAAMPRNMDMMVMVLGVTPSRYHILAKNSPIGLVKYMSSHSSVSSDLKDSWSSCRNVFVSKLLVFMSFTFKCGNGVRSIITAP